MSTFAGWLFAQSGRDDPIGDLAALVVPDPHYPGGNAGLEQWTRYFERRGDGPLTLQALTQAFAEYRGE